MVRPESRSRHGRPAAGTVSSVSLARFGMVRGRTGVVARHLGTWEGAAANVPHSNFTGASRLRFRRSFDSCETLPNCALYHNAVAGRFQRPSGIHRVGGAVPFRPVSGPGKAQEVRAPLLDFGNEFRHTDVVKTVGLRNEDERAGRKAGTGSSAAPATVGGEGHTRAAIVQLLLEDGPITATAIGTKLGLAPAGVRRHLDALIDSGQARASRSAPWQQKGRGRPAKQYQLTAAGRGQLGHAYDDLAGAAIRQLGEIGGEQAIAEFARRRARTIVAGIEPIDAHTPESVTAKAEELAEAFTDAGFAASTRKVGAGVQICQHHCPVSHVAEEFPQLCAAELEAFRELLGTHVQRLATIANGDCACTTHVPLFVLPITDNKKRHPAAQPAAGRTNDSGRSAE